MWDACSMFPHGTSREESLRRLRYLCFATVGSAICLFEQNAVASQAPVPCLPCAVRFTARMVPAPTAHQAYEYITCFLANGGRFGRSAPLMHHNEGQHSMSQPLAANVVPCRQVIHPWSHRPFPTQASYYCLFGVSECSTFVFINFAMHRP